MHLPQFMRAVNRVFTNPLMMSFAGYVPPLAIVHHVGRKTGRAYRTPTIAFPTGKGFVIPMTYGRDVDWARNLVAAGGGAIERMGERHLLKHPHVVGTKAALPHLPTALRPALQFADFPGYVVLDAAPDAAKRGGKAKPAAKRRRRK